MGVEHDDFEKGDGVGGSGGGWRGDTEPVHTHRWEIPLAKASDNVIYFCSYDLQKCNCDSGFTRNSVSRCDLFS